MSSPQVVLAFPIFLQEMVMAAWLIAKGFDPRAVAPSPVTATAPASATALAGAQSA